VRRSILPLLVALAATLVAAPATAAAPKTNLADVEDEVMCPICGTLLELSEAPQAERQRVLIRRLIAAGRTKEEIKDRLVVEYGEAVLATPDDSGFDLAAWIVPVAAFAVAVAALALGVRRWRRDSGPDGDPPRGDRPSDEDAARLESDLARYDL
jgi:cytochrome c-type biogenesis protein CcmH